MSLLFWLFWVLDFLLLLMAIIGKGFRASFGANVDLNVIIISVTLIILIAGMLLRYAAKQKWISLVVVALPILAVLLMFIIDKISGQAQ